MEAYPYLELDFGVQYWIRKDFTLITANTASMWRDRNSEVFPSETS